MAPVPMATGWPTTIREAGEVRRSMSPCRVEEIRNAAAVSNVTLRKGEVEAEIPVRLHGRHPPWSTE